MIKDVRQRLASKIGCLNRKYRHLVLPMVIFIGHQEYDELRTDMTLGYEMKHSKTMHGYNFIIVTEESYLRVAMVDDLDE